MFRSFQFTCCLLESGSAGRPPGRSMLDYGVTGSRPSAGTPSASAISRDHRSTCRARRLGGKTPLRHQMIPPNTEFCPNFTGIFPKRRLCRGLVWLPNVPILRSTKSWQLATATCTERSRLCFSSMSIWKPSCITFMPLSRPPLLMGKASRACTEDVRIPELRRWLRPASAQGKMNLVSTVRHGAIALGITVTVAVGVYLAVLLSLFDL